MNKTFGKNQFFKYAVIAIIMASNAIAVYADTPNRDAAQVPLEKTGQISNGRPKSPERNNILCYYENGKLYFNFAYPVGICNVRITDFTFGSIYEYSIDSSGIDYVLSIGETINALIEITTSNGNSYQGILAV